MRFSGMEETHGSLIPGGYLKLLDLGFEGTKKISNFGISKVTVILNNNGLLTKRILNDYYFLVVHKNLAEIMTSTIEY